MAVQVMGEALRTTGVTSTEKLVLIGLADHANHDGTGAWPSVATLAEYADVTERTVQRCLRSLEDKGLIQKGDQRHVQHVRADKRPTVYDVTLDRGDVYVAPQLDGVTPVSERGDTSVADGVTPVSPKPSLEPSMNLGPSDDGPTHQEVVDRLAQVCGIEPPWPKSEMGRIAKAAKELREMGLQSLDVIDAKARAYRRKWPDLDMTPQALTGNWSQLDADVRRSGGASRPPPVEAIA